MDFLIFWAILGTMFAAAFSIVGLVFKYAEEDEHAANVSFLISILALIWPVSLVGVTLFGVYQGLKGAMNAMNDIWNNKEKP